MSKNINLTEAEEKLAALIWKNAQLPSPVLVELAESEMNWKKATELKRLIEEHEEGGING